MIRSIKMESKNREIRGRVAPKTKKETIISLFRSGIREIETIAELTGGKPSYVASVLLAEGLIDNYFDLYTSTGRPMNVYSKHFLGKLGFKDVETAVKSIEFLESAYRRYESRHDRAGQHHALEMALTMLDRARWTGKLAEAELYRQWLVRKISTPLVDNSRPQAVAESEITADETGDRDLRLAA
jgi:hypothetical protein